MGFVVFIILLHCCLPVSTSYSLPGFPKRYSNTSSNTSDETKPYVIQLSVIFLFSLFRFLIFFSKQGIKKNITLIFSNFFHRPTDKCSKRLFKQLKQGSFLWKF